jgi:hypothetical protein
VLGVRGKDGRRVKAKGKGERGNGEVRTDQNPYKSTPSRGYWALGGASFVCGIDRETKAKEIVGGQFRDAFRRGWDWAEGRSRTDRVDRTDRTMTGAE